MLNCPVENCSLCVCVCVCVVFCLFFVCFLFSLFVFGGELSGGHCPRSGIRRSVLVSNPHFETVHY